MQMTNGGRQHYPFLTFSLATIYRLLNFQTHRWFLTKNLENLSVDAVNENFGRHISWSFVEPFVKEETLRYQESEWV